MMKKLAKRLFIMVAIMAVLMVLAVKAGVKITRTTNNVRNVMEAVEVETKEESKKLDGVIMFMNSQRKFLCYQVIYTDGSFDVATDLNSMVDILNERTNDMYVQNSDGKIQQVDIDTKKVSEIKMAHAISEDLW